MSTKKMIKQAIQTLDNKIETLKSDKNSQVVLMVIEMRAEKQTLEAVLNSLNGDNSLLRTYL